MIHFEKITYDNLFPVTKLKVREDQRDFVADNYISIMEAYVVTSEGGIALPFGIYDDDTLVGFLMFGYDSVDEDDPKIAHGNYCLWRFMIDERFQNKGLGSAALKEAIAYLKTYPVKEAGYCWLSYDKDNQTAKALYEKAGFRENGELCEDEIVAVLEL